MSDEIADAIRGTLSLGSERTMQSDVEFGLQQLADIGLRALSPGVNDPTTAAVIVDHLAALAIQLANRGEPDAVREGDDGTVRLILSAPSFEALVATAFEQIRHYGSDNPAFARYLASTLQRAATLVPPAQRQTVLRFAAAPAETAVSSA